MWRIAACAAVVCWGAPQHVAGGGCALYDALQADAVLQHRQYAQEHAMLPADGGGSADPAHRPYITQVSSGSLKVTVGRGTVTGAADDAVHPQRVMDVRKLGDLHYIERIWVVDRVSGDIVALGVYTGTSAPELHFVLPHGVRYLRAFVLCNWHGVHAGDPWVFTRPQARELPASSPPPAPREETCPYTILGIPHDADDAAIRRAYRRLVKQHHPDLAPAHTGGKAMARINNAYNALTNTALRAQVDKRTDPWEVDNWVRRRPAVTHDKLDTAARAVCEPQVCAADRVGADARDPNHCLQHSVLRANAHIRQSYIAGRTEAYAGDDVHEGEHMPVLTVSHRGVGTVVVHGHPQHPSEDPALVHYIASIYVVDQDGATIAATLPAPTDARAELAFDVPSGTSELTPYALCNRHGLFKGAPVAVGTTAGTRVVCGVAACGGQASGAV